MKHENILGLKYPHFGNLDELETPTVSMLMKAQNDSNMTFPRFKKFLFLKIKPCFLLQHMPKVTLEHTCLTHCLST